MPYKNFFLLTLFLFFVNCSADTLSKKKNIINNKDRFINKGFSLIYSENLYNEKIISNKLEERSLIIFQKNLRYKTQVKIKNMLNNKSLIAKVGKKSNYPYFYNSVISQRIASELEIDINEPYIEIMEMPEDSLFTAKKAKTFDEEKKVANKVPVNDISINDLNQKKILKKKNAKQIFSYIIKIGDFYFKDTALMMINRIQNETSIQTPRFKKISDKKYRVFLGPYDKIISLQKSFNDINILEFENIEIIRND